MLYQQHFQEGAQRLKHMFLHTRFFAEGIRMIQKLILALIAISFLAPAYRGQTVKDEKTPEDEVTLRKTLLTGDVKLLGREMSDLTDPLQRAFAGAVVASAGWSLDQDWAKGLLRDAYELTLPDEKEREGLRERPLGTDPTEPDGLELRRAAVRGRVLAVARRDKAFADQLVKWAGEQLGKMQQQGMYSKLADWSLKSEDLEAASQYAWQAIEAEPTQLSGNILNMALKDRDAADRLIIKYIDLLKTIQISRNSAIRIYLGLNFAVFPNSFTSITAESRPVPPAGPQVVKAYLSYVIESLANLEQREPGSVIALRNHLLQLWPLVQEYAPDLISPFSQLAVMSRTQGQDVDLPTVSFEETRKAIYDQSLSKAHKTNTPEDIEKALRSAILYKDFDEARRLMTLLEDERLREKFAEDLNLNEAISLTRKGDMIGAQRLAQKLTLPQSILRVYPGIINLCASEKDMICALSLANEAVKRLKRFSERPELPRVYGELASSLAPIDQTMALELLDEMVRAANRVPIGTDNGYPGFNVNVFTVLASAHEERVGLAAKSLSDRLQRIASLAAIYEWKAEQLNRQEGDKSRRF